MKISMKFETAKNVFLVAIAIAVLGAAYVGAQEIMNHFALKNKLIQEQMVVLKESVVSNRIQIDTAALEKKISDLDRSITALVKERDQQITDIGKTVVSMKKSVDLVNRKSEHVYKGKFEQYYKEIMAKDAEGNEYPIAWVMFYPNNPEDKKWKSGTFASEIHQQIVLAENDERGDVYVEAWKKVKKRGYKEREFPLKIESAEWVKREKTDKEWFFNPRLSLGAAFSSEMFPQLGVSFWSYGRTKTDMDWRILDVGIGVDSDNTYFTFSPAQYNIGHWLPLIDNTFIGPFIGVSSDSDESTLFGISLDIPL